MAPPPDDTEQLLARLEPELADKQAVVDARLAREKERLDAAQAQLEALVHGKAHAETQLAALLPRRDALLAEREQLKSLGATGSKARAALWATAVIVLTAGAIVPLPLVLLNQQLPPPLLLGVPAALGLGYWLGGLAWRRR